MYHLSSSQLKIEVFVHCGYQNSSPILMSELPVEYNIIGITVM